MLVIGRVCTALDPDTEDMIESIVEGEGEGEGEDGDEGSALQRATNLASKIGLMEIQDDPDSVHIKVM